MSDSKKFVSFSLAIVVVALALAYILILMSKRKASADFVLPPNTDTPGTDIDSLVKDIDISDLNSQFGQ